MFAPPYIVFFPLIKKEWFFRSATSGVFLLGIGGVSILFELFINQ